MFAILQYANRSGFLSTYRNSQSVPKWGSAGVLSRKRQCPHSSDSNRRGPLNPGLRAWSSFVLLNLSAAGGQYGDVDVAGIEGQAWRRRPAIFRRQGCRLKFLGGNHFLYATDLSGFSNFLVSFLKKIAALRPCESDSIQQPRAVRKRLRA